MRSLDIRIVWSAVIMLTMAACNDEPGAHKPPEPLSFELPVFTVMVNDIPRLYRVPGSVKSDERIELSSRISGFIQMLAVREGDRVEKGQLLVEIDPTDVEGAIDMAKAALQSAATALEDAERDVIRLSGLKRKGAVSNETYRKAKVRRDVARSTKNQAKATLETALSARRYASVKSPIDGIVVARQKQVGDLATPGAPVLTLESRSRLLFKTSVAESRIAHIKLDDEVVIKIDALGKADIDGVVLRVIHSGDPVTRRYDVEISLPPEIKAYPGMFGRAQIVIGSRKTPIIPRAALIERGGLRGVFLLDEQSRARFRWVRTGREWSDLIEIKVGLIGGETILARDDRRVRDGVVIKTQTGISMDE